MLTAKLKDQPRSSAVRSTFRKSQIVGLYLSLVTFQCKLYFNCRHQPAGEPKKICESSQKNLELLTARSIAVGSSCVENRKKFSAAYFLAVTIVVHILPIALILCCPLATLFSRV